MKVLITAFLLLPLMSCNNVQPNNTEQTYFANTQQNYNSHAPIVPNSSNYPASLMWKNGVPFLNVSRPEDKHLRGFNPDKTNLVWQAGIHQIELNPIDVQFYFGTTNKKQVDQLSFEVLTSNGATYSLKLQLPPKIDHGFPIRLIETGNWFHYLSIHEFTLEPHYSGEKPINLEGHLDWKTWLDSGSISLTLNPNNELQIKEIKPLWTNNPQGIDNLKSKQQKQGTTLALSYNIMANQEISWFDMNKEALTNNIKIASRHSMVNFEPSTKAWEIRLPKIEQLRGVSKTSPEALNRTTRNSFTLSNSSNEEQIVNLRFIHPKHAQQGFVPILRDANGVQTGWPIQVSKNWHIRAGHPRITNDGPWSHTSISLKVPARSIQDYTYEIVHANFHGVPATSVAQLSLVGWGGNGFWLEAALGNWSEHFCFQPGRALRRSMITDIRPLFQKAMKAKKNDNGYDWTSNVGGGDVGLLHDENGKYIQWKQAKTEFHSLGPILSEVSIDEITSNNSAKLRSTFIIPRSDDLNRNYIKLQFEVLKPLAISRFALFQFGSDYYASGRSVSVKYGRGNAVKESAKVLTPLNTKSALKSASSPWLGNAPWALLPAQLDPENLRIGYGNRVAILRDFSATIAGKKLNNAWLYSHSVKDNSEGGNVNIELGIDPKIVKLMPGDIINATIEAVTLPASADYFLGKDANIKKLLNQDNGMQALAINEAVNNQVTITKADGTILTSSLPEITYADAIQGFSVSGGQGWYPIKITGLPQPSSVYWAERISNQYTPLGKKFSEELESQWDWQAESNTWNSVLSLRSLANGQTQRHIKLL